MLFSAHQISCIRSERVLFEQLDFAIDAGQIWQIAGRNGAGKSSLLRILAGLSEPIEGELRYKDQPLAQVQDEFAANLCFIGHLSGVQPQLTALENLAFWRACYRLKPADDWALLAQLGLAGLEDIPCQNLSAGQHRRVSLARLWLTDAQLWILDEPFTALDVSAIAELKQRLVAHCQQGGAIILTTHQTLDLQEIPLQQLTLEYRW